MEVASFLPESCARVSAPLYCAVCTVPHEYCQWFGQWDACKASLKEIHPELFSQMYPELVLDALTINELSTAEEQKAEVEEPVKEKVKKRVKGGQVIIKKVSRSKRKCSILIQGLDAYGIFFQFLTNLQGIDLKKLSKVFSSRFACGSAVSKIEGGGEEIVVQGDVQDDVYDYILEHFSVVLEDDIQMLTK